MVSNQMIEQAEMPEYERYLAQWEKELCNRIHKGVHLIGDIKLSEEDAEELAHWIGQLIQNNKWNEVKPHIVRDFPCTFVVFLVTQGILGYKAGEFWPIVDKSIKCALSPPQHADLGKLFEAIVRKLGLPTFDSIKGHRYVGRILLHGGIPNYCLPNFFEHFLQYYRKTHIKERKSVEAFLQERLKKAGKTYVASKPVIKFLKHGNAVAVNFMKRCLEMARRIEEGEQPSPDELELPARVIVGYQDWLRGTFNRVLRRKYRRPSICLDPWGQGVYLLLPEQDVTDEMNADSRTSFFWRVSDMPEKSVEVYQEETRWKTRYCEVPLTYLAPGYQIAFASSKQERIKEWYEQCLGEEQPWAWFDPDKQGQLIKSPRALPSKKLWILRSPEVTLQTDPLGSLHISEVFSELPGEWRNFICEEINLEHVQRLRIRRTEEILKEYRIYSPQEQPQLVGEPYVKENDIPLYIGSPPLLYIPRSLFELSPLRWRVTLENEGPALPGEISETLDRSTLIEKEEGIFWDLKKLLGEEAMGTFHVKVRGPLSIKTDFSFRILPKLEMTGHETFYLPGEHTEARLLVETDAHTTLRLQPDASGCRVIENPDTEEGHLYEVSADISRTIFPLQFVRRRVVVPFAVPIRRLRWKVVCGSAQAFSSSWSTDSISLPLDLLEQSGAPTLIVDLFGGVAEDLDVTLLLMDEDGEILQKESGRWKKGHPYLRFNLAAFLDTIRRAPTLNTVFALLIKGLPQQETLTCSVFKVTRTFVVERIHVESALHDDDVTLRLQWEPGLPIRHRVARLWPIWRPWEQPVEILIPDTVAGEYAHKLPITTLIPGKYRVELYVQDPWSSEDPEGQKKASTDLSNAYAVIPPDAAAIRLRQLEELSISDTSPFLITLECAIISHESNPAIAQKALQWCVEHIEQASIEHILILVHKCKEMGTELYRQLQKAMLKPSQVVKLRDAFDEGIVTGSVCKEYLVQLSSIQWSLDACKILLQIPHEPVRTHVIQKLLQQRHPYGIHTIIQWIKEGRISGADALKLFESGDLAWIAEELKRLLYQPEALKLLKEFQEEYASQVPVTVVFSRYWVRCTAGWGVIERIEAADGTEREFFPVSSHESGLRLHVSLRAYDYRYPVERVIISLDEGKIYFSDAQRVYSCTKCRQFATRDVTLVVNKHNREAHGGIEPGYACNSAVLDQEGALTFRSKQPSNPWE